MHKTLAEWMMDSTTKQGDTFRCVEDSLYNNRRAIINGWGCLVIIADDDEHEPPEHEDVQHVSLAELRSSWERLPMDLRQLTAQEALDRGVVILNKIEQRCTYCDIPKSQCSGHK